MSGDRNPSIVLTASIHLIGKDPLSIDESEVKPEMTTGHVVDERGNPVAGAYIYKYVKRSGPMRCGNSLFMEKSCYTNTRGFFGQDFGKDTVITIGVDDQKGPYGGQLFPNITAGSKDNRLVVKDLPTIGGHVVDAATGNPITSFKLLNPSPSGAEQITDPAGHFSLQLTFAGAINLAIEADGYTRNVFTVEDPFAPESRNLTLRMSSGCSLSGIVRDETGKPAQYARVTDGNQFATTGPDGAYTLAGISAGKQQIHLNADNYAGQIFYLDFIEGQTLHQDFELVPCGIVRGRLDVVSHPIAPGRDFIVLQKIETGPNGFSGGGGSGRIQADGRFELLRVPPGDYRLNVDVDGDGRDEEFQVKVNAGEMVDMGLLQNEVQF